MTTDALIIAAVIAFFGVFGVTLFTVSIWSNLPARQAPRPDPVRARRPAEPVQGFVDAPQA